MRAPIATILSVLEQIIKKEYDACFSQCTGPGLNSHLAQEFSDKGGEGKEV